MRLAKLFVLAALFASILALPMPSQADVVPTTKPSDAEQADVRRDQLNLMNVTQAILHYAAEHGRQLPPSLGDTLPYIQQWTAWTKTAHPKLKPSEQAALYLSAQDMARAEVPQQPTADWVNAHTSYLYLGHGGQKFDKLDWDKTVIIYLKPEEHHVVTGPGGKRVEVYPVAFLDAHAEAESKERTDSEIARSKDALHPGG